MRIQNDRGYAGYPGNGTTTFDTSQFINSLNTAQFGGYSDWRLPKKDELQSLVDRETEMPRINKTYFPKTQMSWYWSSTTDANRISYTSMSLT